MKRVTVVIPIYKDWTTLSACIESLKKYLGSENKVLLVNDMGSEWKELESKIHKAIEGYSNFHYAKNEYNMGFVKTCNRAVLELDKSENDILLLNSDTEVTAGFLEEMQKVLQQEERVGAVCPRSNRATFLSVPINRNNTEVSPKDSYAVYEQIRALLPEAEEIWTGVGFAFLIKREIIKQAGLFDEIFGRGYNEENDFCMRIRQMGYKIMKANRAFVFHMEGVSFQKEKLELELRNSSVLLKRYPYYWDCAKEYELKTDAVDYYADILTDVIYQKKRILICLMQETDKKRVLELVKECQRNMELGECDYQLAATKRNAGIIHWRNKKFPVCPMEKLSGTFHIAYSMGQISETEKAIICRHSPVCIPIGRLSDIAVSADCEKYNQLSEKQIKALREMWEWGKQADPAGTAQEKRIYLCIKAVKHYLYTHHIWLYILWNKIKHIRA